MKRTRPVEPTAKETDVPGIGVSKSKTFFQNATDTFKELALIFLVTIVAGGIAYSIFEHINVLDGVWWAFVTAFTVGYGDVVPGTVAGRVIAALLMTVSVFVIVPLVTALMTKKMVVDDDAWTNEEQMYLIQTAKRMNDYLDAQETNGVTSNGRKAKSRN